MSFASTIAGELRRALQDLDRLTPHLRKPELYHETKSEIRFTLEQACLLLEGNFDIVRPPEPKPAGGAKRPYVIEDRNGNVVRVDFKARRRIETPPTKPKAPPKRSR
jgi:hypothetical protein